MQAKQQPSNISINLGTVPGWIERLGHPEIFNLFVGEKDCLYSTPGLDIIKQFTGGRATHYTQFGGGGYICVTSTQVLRITPSGFSSVIQRITFSGLPVQIDENQDNQITIVDGAAAYVIDQKAGSFTKLTSTQGFPFKTPCSVVVLNTFTIILDKSTRTWIVSGPNNALVYSTINTVPELQTQSGTPMSLATIQNNLYIMGTLGIERWIPNLNTNTYAFPFSRDSNFKVDDGPIGTAAVTRGINTIYYLSSRFVATAFNGATTQPLESEGMSRVISQYDDVENCACSFYSFRGLNFFQLTFPTTGIAWSCNLENKTWGLVDDLILSSPPASEVVITPSGLYSLSLTPGYKRRRFVGDRFFGDKGQQNFRDTLNGVEVWLVQGLQQKVDPTHKSPQYLEMTISKDSKSWLNTVNRPIGKTGRRLSRTRWRTNITGYEFTPRIEYFGDLDLTIYQITMNLK